MKIKILPAPTAHAGNDTSSCSNNAAIQLNGQVTSGTGGTWSVVSPPNAGTFNNPNNLNAIFTPSAQEITQGFAYVILTGHGLILSCPSKNDTLKLTFVPGPTATILAVGDSLRVCKDTAVINLNSSVTLASGVTWTSSGTGTFTPANTFATQYHPSAADASVGNVSLYVSTTGNGTCKPSRDSLKVIFYGVPTVNVTKTKDTVCTTGTIPITATTSTGTGYWTTSGNGAFLPNNLGLNATYVPGNADGSGVNLIFHTTNNTGCKSQVDTLKLKVIAGPNNAFNNTSVCPGKPMSFTDASTISAGFIAGWQWNFGDNTNGTGANPNHIYATSGTYTVSLVTTSNYGCNDTLKKSVIVYHNPIANFTPSIVCMFQPTHFFDASTVVGSTITNWQWHFSNGQHPTTQNPTDSFNIQTGNTGTLVVTSAQGCKDSITKPITVLPRPIANFNADNYIVDVGQVVNFTDASTPSVQWNWAFSDNSSNSLVQNPSHSWNIGGLYPVTLV
ncbi:MAG TPA: PKD domain-containing protein, partial [Nitrosopumilaceae archaeon]|nr:PKD domain-containing protein [Nitrosopumilaceae archaeon]